MAAQSADDASRCCWQSDLDSRCRGQTTGGGPPVPDPPDRSSASLHEKACRQGWWGRCRLATFRGKTPGH